MNRQEQIKQQAKLLCNTVSPEEYFIMGAEWADAHPDIDVRTMAAWKSGYQAAIDEHPHWISVEDYTNDELPPLIDEKYPYGESVHVLFVVELDGIQFISKGCFDYDSGMWHALETDCSYCKENVTHWMALPAPPKKETNKKGGND